MAPRFLSLLWGKLPLFNGQHKPCTGICVYHANMFGYVLMHSCHLQEGHTGPCCCGHRMCRSAREFEMANTQKLERLRCDKYEFSLMGGQIFDVDEELLRFVAGNLHIEPTERDFIIDKKSGKVMKKLIPDQKYFYVSVA